MIEMNIPGRGKVQIDYLVCDVNGTLAVDGVLLPGVISMLKKLKDTLQVFLITANTHGKQGRINEELGIEAILIQKNEEKEQKRKFVSSIVKDTITALKLIQHPMRLVATLRE